MKTHLWYGLIEVIAWYCGSTGNIFPAILCRNSNFVSVIMKWKKQATTAFLKIRCSENFPNVQNGIYEMSTLSTILLKIFLQTNNLTDLGLKSEINLYAQFVSTKTRKIIHKNAQLNPFHAIDLFLYPLKTSTCSQRV